MCYENELRWERGRRKEKVCEEEIEERIGEKEGSEEVEMKKRTKSVLQFFQGKPLDFMSLNIFFYILGCYLY